MIEVVYHERVRSLGIFHLFIQNQSFLQRLLGLKLELAQAGLLSSQCCLYLPQQHAGGQSPALGQPVVENSPEPDCQARRRYAHYPQSCIAQAWSPQSLA